jgi:DNA-binding NtrC family response regulator
VADDVEAIRNVIAHWLVAKGHHVDAARSGDEAIKFLKARPVDLVIADVLMPEGDGLDLIRETKRSRPEARILVISGGGRYMAAPDCIKIAKGLGAHATLLKPFTEQQLLDGVHAALAA